MNLKLMDWNTISTRLKDHPVIVVLSVVSAVVIPYIALFANLLSPALAIGVSIIFVAGVLAIVVWPSQKPTTSNAVLQQRYSTPPPVPVRREDLISQCKIVRGNVQRQFVAGYGDKGRLDYFLQRVKGQDPRDKLYCEAIESLKDDPQWAVVASAVDEWISIGFNSIVEWNAGWKNSGTLNQLYIAAYNSLLKDDELRFQYGKGVEFAQAVGAIVARRRRAGH